MAASIASRRLQRELQAILRDPIPNVVARPLEENILEWHYVIAGTADSPYAGGHYHGKLIFPPDYPLRPPGVLMLTPSGRFKTNRRLCLSMSDFHPESWNPMWSVSTIITGLYSFMLETTSTLGSTTATPAERRLLARGSLAFNVKDDTFRSLFPDLVELHDARAATEPESDDADAADPPAPASAAPTGPPGGAGAATWLLVVAALAAAAAAALAASYRDVRF